MTDSQKEKPAPQIHSFFMKKAISHARKAAALDEPPIGAVLVKDGRVLSSGYNLRESRQDVTLHAEMTAIRKACRKLRSWRLDECDLYVTLEPCIMCAGAIQQAKIRAVYFGAADPKGGGILSKAQILDLPLNHKVRYEGGVLGEECGALLKDFFAAMRLRDKETGLTKGQRRIRNKSVPTPEHSKIP